MEAVEIVGLLAAKHSKDVFVDECKNGRSYGHGLLRLDAWAMRRSWANFGTIGYEIKVNRQDFLRDEKWKGYLSMCHEFYFVAPKGVIEPDELPPEAGLVVPSANCKRLLTKKKAPSRQIEFPEDVFVYILMCRTTVGRELGKTREQRVAGWRRWLEDRTANKDLGYRVSGAVAKHAAEMEVRAHRAERTAKRACEVEEILKELGINSVHAVRGWRARQHIEAALRGIDEETFDKLRRARTAIDALIETEPAGVAS